MTLRLLLLLCLASAPAGATVVRVGGDPAYPPHHFIGPDGRADGFDVALLRLIAADQGLELREDFGEWGRTLSRLEHGELDVVPMFVSDDRRHRFLFTRPFLRRQHLLYGRPGSRIAEPGDLAGKRVAVQFGGMAWEWLNGNDFGAVIKPVNEESLVLVEVVRGDADYALLPANIGAYTIATQRLTGIEPVGGPWLERDYAFGVNPARPDLVARLDAGLRAVEADGRLDELVRHWLRPPPVEADPWRDWPAWGGAALVMAGLLLVLGLVLAWNIRTGKRRPLA